MVAGIREIEIPSAVPHDAPLGSVELRGFGRAAIAVRSRLAVDAAGNRRDRAGGQIDSADAIAVVGVLADVEVVAGNEERPRAGEESVGGRTAIADRPVVAWRTAAAGDGADDVRDRIDRPHPAVVVIGNIDRAVGGDGDAA